MTFSLLTLTATSVSVIIISKFKAKHVKDENKSHKIFITAESA